MTRTLYPYPGPVDFGLLLGELRAADPAVVDCNDVGGEVAVYTPDAADLAAVVAAHAGPPAYGPLDATGALATLLVVEGVLAIADAANAIHEEQAHLVAEAEAWSLAP